MRNGIIATGIAGALALGGVDAAVLDEQPIKRVEQIGEERVEAKQIENHVETTFPWKDQEAIKVSYDMGEPTIVERVADKRKQQVATEVVDFGDGGFKVDVLLNEKPDTNRFCYTIEGAENYDFFYQPALTEEEIAGGATRPEEIVGSYAVYHKELKDHRVGGENYATGKVMHIPRPQVWEVDDEENTTEWAELSYGDGELCVTVRQDFLDEAEYPVRVDPTFGYSSIGGTERDMHDAQAEIRGTKATPAEAGDVTEIQVYASGESTLNWPVLRTGLYVSGDSSLVTPQSTEITVNSTTNQWWVTSLTPSVTAQEYAISILADVDALTSSESLNIFYDVVASAGVLDTATYPTWPDPATFGSANEKYSIYATYTADGGEPVASSTPTVIID